jgi:ankyrin repeat protein
LCFLLTKRDKGDLTQFQCAHRGDIQKLRVTLTPENINDTFGRGWTVLHYLIRSGNGSVECAKYCVDLGADLTARDGDECTPLYLASADERNSGIVRVLLDANAIVHATGSDGYTPLYIALRNDYVNVAKLLIDRGAQVSNVEFDSVLLTAIPDWVNTFIESRSTCRSVAIIFIGMRKYQRTNIIGNIDVNVLKLVSKHIWSSRMDDMWSQSLQ